MAQTYYPGTQTLATKGSSFQPLSGSEKLLKVEDVQEAYIEHKDR